MGLNQSPFAITLFIFSLFSWSGSVSAQIIPMDVEYQNKYSQLTDSERQKADRLFMLSISERDFDIAKTLGHANSISNAYHNNPEEYRMFFNRTWAETHIQPTYQTTFTPPPERPEKLNSTDPWGYPNFLKQEISERFASNAQWKTTKEIGSNLTILFPASRLANIGEHIFGNFFDSKESSLLLDHGKVTSAYKIAIDATQSSKTDHVLGAVIDEFFLEPYKDKIGVIEIALGTSVLNSGDQPERTRLEADKIKEKQKAAVERIQRDIEQKKENQKPRTDQSQKPATEDNHSLKYELGEFEGLSRLLTSILQQSDPDSARQLAQYSEALVRFGTLYDNYFNQGTIGPMAFAGGWATIVVSIVNSGAEYEERFAIFSSLKSITEGLKDLRRLFLTGFEQIDSKLEYIIGLQMAVSQTTQASLDQLKDISLQTLSSIRDLSVQLNVASLAEAQRNYEQLIEQTKNSVVSKCTLLGASSGGIADCKRQMYRTLLFDTRAAWSKALSVSKSAHPSIYSAGDVTTFSDAMFSSLLNEVSEAPGTQLIQFEGTQEMVPAGFVSPVLWLYAIKELRSKVELAKQSFSTSDLELLSAVEKDGKALEAAFDELSQHGAQKAWEQYLASVAALDKAVKSALSAERVFQTRSDLTFDLWNFCFDCDFLPSRDLKDLKDHSPEWIMAHLEWISSHTHPQFISPWQARNSIFSIFDGLFVHQIAQTVDKNVMTGRSLKDGSFLVSYSSLPEKFRQQLKIPEIEKLNEFGALRLYAHFFNVFREGPLLPKPDDFSGCGPIQPGGGCLKSQRLYGEMEIVATTGLFEETEQILKVAREKFGPNFDEAIVKGWVGEFKTNRKFKLFSYKLNIGLLLPITPEVGGLLCSLSYNGTKFNLHLPGPG